MVIKGQVEIPNETKTGFNVLHNETSADMVLFSGTDTTVADVLEDLMENGGVSAGDVDALTDTFVTKVAGKDLSTNDFTDAYKTAIDGLSSTYATKAEIAKVYKPKGSVANAAALPASADEGDVYNLLAGGGTDENGVTLKEGDNVVKTATGWDVLGGDIDLSGYVAKDGAKVLSTNDFTDAYKNQLDGLSGLNTSNVMQVYVGNTAPSGANVIWFDTSAYE